MKAKIILALFLAFVIFGCIAEQKNYDIKKEKLLNKNEYDIDGDGVWDYAIYDFQKMKINEKTSIHRFVVVTNVQTGTYKKFNNLTDLYVQGVDSELTTFTIEKKQDSENCIKKIGLSAGKCITASTCTNLCALNSERCKAIAAVYPELVGNSIISYQKISDEIDEAALNAKTLLPELVRDEKNEKKELYLDYLFDIKNNIAEINSNPLVAASEVKMCEQGNYGIERIAAAAKKIGDYEANTLRYKYAVFVEIDADGEAFSDQPVSIALEDSIPFAVEPDLISSPQAVIKSVENGKTSVKWSYSSFTTKNYLLAYSFQTEKTPEEYIGSLENPKTKISYANLMVVGWINSLFLFVSQMVQARYFAAGVAIGIALSVLMFLYTLVSLAFAGAKGVASGKKATEAIFSKIAKTPIRWKFSIPAAIIMLIIAFVLNNYLSPEPLLLKNITDIATFDFENTNAMLVHLSGMIVAIGAIVMLYDGLENLVKVSLLDKYYSSARRARREDYLGQVAQLKEEIAELKALIEKASAHGLDVGRAQDAVLSISSQRIALLERKMTPENAILVAESLDKIEAAIEDLKEKIKVVETEWTKWKDEIEKQLMEKSEITSKNLTFIKPELRSWALARYASEKPEDEVIFEKDVLKRKKVTAPMLLRELTNKKMLKGGIIIKEENIIASYIEGGKSTTIASVLLLRLRAYIYSLMKAMGQGNAESFVSVGEKTILLIAKVNGYDCALFIPRDKVKEAYEMLKERMKMISE